VEIRKSARKHGISDEAIRHAVEHPLVAEDLGDNRFLYLGTDHAANFLEVISLLADDGEEVVIHAMPPARQMETASAMTTKRTYHGVELTDEVVEQIAEHTLAQLDALDPAVMVERARLGRPLLGSEPTEVMPVRVEPTMRQAIAARARADRVSQSEVVRRALSAYLAGKKAPAPPASLINPTSTSAGSERGKQT